MQDQHYGFGRAAQRGWHVHTVLPGHAIDDDALIRQTDRVRGGYGGWCRIDRGTAATTATTGRDY
jgi:hypothetical protein